MEKRKRVRLPAKFTARAHSMHMTHGYRGTFRLEIGARRECSGAIEAVFDLDIIDMANLATAMTEALAESRKKLDRVVAILKGGQ